MDKNPEGSDQWHTSIIVPFPYTKFQPSKLQGMNSLSLFGQAKRVHLDVKNFLLQANAEPDNFGMYV